MPAVQLEALDCQTKLCFTRRRGPVRRGVRGPASQRAARRVVSSGALPCSRLCCSYRPHGPSPTTPASLLPYRCKRRPRTATSHSDNIDIAAAAAADAGQERATWRVPSLHERQHVSSCTRQETAARVIVTPTVRLQAVRAARTTDSLGMACTSSDAGGQSARAGTSCPRPPASRLDACTVTSDREVG